MPGLQHLGPLLAMIWSAVSKYGFISSTTETYVRGPPLPFYRAFFEGISIENMEDPTDIIQIAEDKQLVYKELSDAVISNNKDKIKEILKAIGKETMCEILNALNDYTPHECVAYTQNKFVGASEKHESKQVGTIR